MTVPGSRGRAALACSAALLLAACADGAAPSAPAGAARATVLPSTSGPILPGEYGGRVALEQSPTAFTAPYVFTPAVTPDANAPVRLIVGRTEARYTLQTNATMSPLHGGGLSAVAPVVAASVVQDAAGAWYLCAGRDTPAGGGCWAWTARGTLRAEAGAVVEVGDGTTVESRTFHRATYEVAPLFAEPTPAERIGAMRAQVAALPLADGLRIALTAKLDAAAAALAAGDTAAACQALQDLINHATALARAGKLAPVDSAALTAAAAATRSALGC